MRAVRLLLLVLSVFVITPCAAARATSASDHDGDKVFDELEAQLGGGGAHAVIVALHAPATAGRVDDIEADVGALGPVTRLRLVEAFTATATADQIHALAARPDVAHVEEDALAVPFGVTAQASFGVTRAREELPGLDGEGLVAAIVDSGVNTTMADLPPSKVVAFADLVNGRDAPYDDLGHGSLVADILAGSGASGAEGRGVAPAAKLVSVKVIDDRAQSSLGKIAEGIQWAVEHRAQYGIDVINLSIGDPQGCGEGTDVASQAVDAAVAAGLLVVAAAGNSGPEPCTVKSPAAAESALTVGAMADLGAGGFANAWFSSRGPTLDGRTKPDISAPGVNVVVATPKGTHEPQIGTSAAAPFVTGAALLMLQANPALTPAQIKAAMQTTAIDFGPVGRDNEYGAGRVDLYAALHAVGAPLATPPAVPEHALWTGTLAEGETATRTVEIADPRFPLAATLRGPSAGFDLALLDPDGAATGTGIPQFLGPSRQEDLSVQAPRAARYTVRVTARAGAGAFVVDLSGGFTADAAAPGLTLEDPGTTRAAKLGGTAGTASGDFASVVVRVRREGVLVKRLAAAPAAGRWALTVPLPDGDYTVEAEQGDRAGNVTRASARGLTVDTVAPAVTLDGFAFTASEAAAFECHVDGGAWTPCASPFTPALPDGRHTLEVRATDAAGNAGLGRADFVIDTPEPVIVEPPVLVPPAIVAPTPLPARAPVLSLTVAKQRLSTVLKRGLTVRATCSTGCRVNVVVAQGKKVVARGTGTTFKLTASARKALAKAKRVTLTVTVSAPGAKPVKRTATLSR